MKKYINWIYKGSVVHVTEIANKHLSSDYIRSMITSGAIKKPENYERYVITDNELSEKEKLVMR